MNIEQRLLPSQHIYIGLRLENNGLRYQLQAEYKVALEYYQRAQSIAERTLHPYRVRHHKILKGIMDTLYHLGNYNQAIEFVISILENDLTVYKDWTMARLSELHLEINDSSKAYQYFQNALIFHQQNQSNNSFIISMLKEKLKKLKRSFLTDTDHNKNVFIHIF